jgi:heavy metal sensor kinase
MLFARIRAGSYYLRVRLAVWYGGVFVLVVSATLFVVHEGSRHTITEETDERLLEDARETAQAVAQLYPDHDKVEQMLKRKADTHTHERLFLQLIEPGGVVRWPKEGVPLGLENETIEFGTNSLIEVGDYHIAQLPVEFPGIPKYLVRVGASQEQINAKVWESTRLMMIAGALVVILAPLGGYWVAGYAIEPLTTILQTTKRLRPTQLSDRLPVRHTGDELDQLSGTINHFLDRIAEYLKRKREFVANAAHELRSPLAAIRSSVEVALGAPRTTAEYETLLETVADECAQLTTLVNQLLLLAESDPTRTSKQQAEFLHLERLVESSLEMFRGVAEERGIALETDFKACGRVTGDPGRLRQVVNNLLDNAIKFTSPGGKIRAEIEQPTGTQTVVLRIRDSGCGIPPHDLPLVFERFYRGDKSREREGAKRGTGLGLSIAAAIVNEYSGEIKVESTVGVGTTFTVTLPAHGAPTEACAPKQQPYDYARE